MQSKGSRRNRAAVVAVLVATAFAACASGSRPEVLGVSGERPTASEAGASPTPAPTPEAAPDAAGPAGITPGAAATRSAPAPAAVPATGSLVVVVTLDGAPMGGAHVVLTGGGFRWEGDTDGSGSFRVDVLGAGTYRLEVVSRGSDAVSCDATSGACVTGRPLVGEARQVRVAAGGTEHQVFAL